MIVEWLLFLRGENVDLALIRLLRFLQIWIFQFLP